MKTYFAGVRLGTGQHKVIEVEVPEEDSVKSVFEFIRSQIPDVQTILVSV